MATVGRWGGVNAVITQTFLFAFGYLASFSASVAGLGGLAAPCFAGGLDAETQLRHETAENFLENRPNPCIWLLGYGLMRLGGVWVNRLIRATHRSDWQALA